MRPIIRKSNQIIPSVKTRDYFQTLVIIGLVLFSILTCGCINIPFISNPEETAEALLPDTVSAPVSTEGTLVPEVVSQNSLEESPYSEEMPPDMFPPQVTIQPTPTALTSNISDWNPYSYLPYPDPPLNHSSINRNDTPHSRKSLNATYSGSIGLAAYAVGKDLNITSGPFSITYTVHPNISSPLDVWAKITVFDPWQNIVAEGGYNRGYPNQETQTMMIYREGRHYMSIEGAFASLDYTIKTGDIAPEVVPTAVPGPEEYPEGEGPY